MFRVLLLLICFPGCCLLKSDQEYRWNSPFIPQPTDKAEPRENLRPERPGVGDDATSFETRPSVKYSWRNAAR